MMLLPQVKLAASPEGLIILAVLYGIFAIIGKAKKAAEKQARPQPEQRPEGEEPNPAPAEGAFSLQAVLREIERVKQEAERRQAPAAPPNRPRLSSPKTASKPITQLSKAERAARLAELRSEKGPLGRHAKTRLESSEEFEDRTSLEDQGSIEGPGRLKDFDETRRQRVEVDQDDEAEAVVERRIREAEARNRPFSEVDHRGFHEKVKETDPVKPARPLGLTPGQLKTAFVWKEILGPPRSEEL